MNVACEEGKDRREPYAERGIRQNTKGRLGVILRRGRWVGEIVPVGRLAKVMVRSKSIRPGSVISLCSPYICLKHRK